jgi:hypothetical protein
MSLRDRRAPVTVSAIVRIVALVLVATACGRGDSQAPRGHAAYGAARATPTVPARPPYRVTNVARSGAIVGRVTATGDTPADSVVHATIDQDVCGASERVPMVERRGNRLANVVVWLDGVRSGKPLPVDRRFELTVKRCAFLPRVQAAITGGMLNVRSLDATTHRVDFRHDGSTVDVVQETDRGQVVPTEKVLARPGLVEAQCGVHRWARAWIRVFDHPYFAVTNRDGTFTIDSVPPGTYRLIAWQPRLGEKEQTVTVEAAKDAQVDLSF